MRDGSTEGMQCFDDEIEKLARANVIDLEAAFSYSTNPGNLRLQLADLLEEQSSVPSTDARTAAKASAPAEPAIPSDPELEITR
jgi:twitching motility protein PilT